MKVTNSRNRGNSFERAKRRELIQIGYPDVVTSRSESRSMDARGVDLLGASLPCYVQCKLSNGRHFNHHRWYMERNDMLPDDKPTVVFNKVTKRTESGRFIEEGEYAVMPLTFFYQLLNRNEDVN